MKYTRNGARARWAQECANERAARPIPEHRDFNFSANMCFPPLNIKLECFCTRFKARHPAIFFGAFCQGMLGLNNFLPTNGFSVLEPLKVSHL